MMKKDMRNQEAKTLIKLTYNLAPKPNNVNGEGDNEGGSNPSILLRHLPPLGLQAQFMSPLSDISHWRSNSH